MNKPKTSLGISPLISRRYLFVLAAAIVLLGFPDAILTVLASILHLVWGIFHFAIGWLHLGFEHLLQEAFGLTRHAAQIITAWVGLLLVVLLGFFAGPRVVTAIREKVRRWRSGLLGRPAQTAASAGEPVFDNDLPD